MTFKIEQLKRRNSVFLPTAARMLNFFDHATEDTGSSVVSAGYFNDARHKLKVGDVIFSKSGIGGTPLFQIINVLTVPASGNITVSVDDVYGAQTAIPDLAGTLTGSVDGTMVDVAAAAAATAGASSPTAGQVDTGIATAVAPIVTGINLQNKELLTKINAILAMLRTAGILAAA